VIITFSRLPVLVRITSSVASVTTALLGNLHFTTIPIYELSCSIEFGLLGGFDYGRVWDDADDPSLGLRTGYTAGVWFNALKYVIISPFYSWSEESNLFNLQIGFGF